jgi:hypothetical protein
MPEVPNEGSTVNARARHGRSLSRTPTTSRATVVLQEASGHFASNTHHPKREEPFMAKATISKRVLDTLIRAKLAKVDPCHRVEPMPVTWRRPNGGGCNWEIPGWTGDVQNVSVCVEQLRDYLKFLSDQFDIAEEEVRS